MASTLISRTIDRFRVAGAAIGHGADRLKRDLAKTRLGASAPLRLVVRVVQELSDDDATHMAASVSYYAVLSLFPLVLGLSAIVGMVAQSPDRQEDVIEFIVDYLPGSEAFVRESLDGVIRFRATLGASSSPCSAFCGLAARCSAQSTSWAEVTWRIVGGAVVAGMCSGPYPSTKTNPLAARVMACSSGDYDQLYGNITVCLFSLGITSVFQWATRRPFSSWAPASITPCGLPKAIVILRRARHSSARRELVNVLSFCCWAACCLGVSVAIAIEFWRANLKIALFLISLAI